MLPVNQQSYEILRSRFEKALVDRINVNDFDPDKRPGTNPDNVFDTIDGFRLIVSVDIISSKEFLHISGSTIHDFSVEEAYDHIIGIFEKISDYKLSNATDVLSTYVSSASVIHIIIPFECFKV